MALLYNVFDCALIFALAKSCDKAKHEIAQIDNNKFFLILTIVNVTGQNATIKKYNNSQMFIYFNLILY